MQRIQFHRHVVDSHSYKLQNSPFIRLSQAVLFSLPLSFDRAEYSTLEANTSGSVNTTIDSFDKENPHKAYVVEFAAMNFNISKESRNDATLRLLRAAREQNMMTLAELLCEKEVNIDQRDEHGLSVLDYAVQHGDVHTIKMLISRGVNFRYKRGIKHPIFHALDKFKVPSRRMIYVSYSPHLISPQEAVLHCLMEECYPILDQVQWQGMDITHYAVSQVRNLNLIDKVCMFNNKTSSTLTKKIRKQLLNEVTTDSLLKKCIERYENQWSEKQKKEERMDAQSKLFRFPRSLEELLEYWSFYEAKGWWTHFPEIFDRIVC